MVLDVYKSHDISLHLNWKDVSTVLWSSSGTGVRELSKFKWAFTNFFKLAQTKRPSKWQLEWILGRLGPGQLGPVHFVKIHKWQFLWIIKLDCYLGSLSGPEGGRAQFLKDVFNIRVPILIRVPNIWGNYQLWLLSLGPVGPWGGEGTNSKMCVE